MFLLPLVLFLCCPPARSDDAGRLTVDDVWFYAPLDGSPTPLIGEGVYEISHRQWDSEGPVPSDTVRPDYREGIVGKGVYIGGRTAARNSDQLSYLFNSGAFPAKAGTLAFWFKPLHPMHENRCFLYEMNWASFDALMQGASLLVYATGKHSDFLKCDISEFRTRWETQWRMFAVTWDGPRVTVYMDGQKVGESETITPLGAPGGSFVLGALPPGPRTAGRTVPTAHADCVFDELAILRRAASPVQVADLHAAGRKTGFKGLLDCLGPGALTGMRRHAFLRGEKASVHVQTSGDAPDARLVVSSGEETVKTFTVPPAEPSITELGTAALRPGRYDVRVELRRGDALLYRSRPALLAVQERRRPEFPVGLGGSLGPSEETLRLYESLHISHTSGNGPHLLTFAKDLDRAFAYGVSLFPNLNIIEVWQPGFEKYKEAPYFLPAPDGAMRVNGEWAWRYLQTLVLADGSTDDHKMTSSASPFSPIAWKIMKPILDDVMTAAADSPGLMALSFQDEVPFRMGPDKPTGKLKVGDYSYYAIEHFKKVTGLKDAAYPPNDPPGTVWPEDHPYLLWMRHIGLPGDDPTTVGFEQVYHRLGQEAKRYRPDVVATNYSGGEYGLNDVVLDWCYPCIWPGPWGSARGGGYLDFIFDRHWARQSVRPRKPLWALLGWWAGAMAKQPDWCVADFRLNTEWALAKGCKQLMWFSAGGGPLDDKESGPFSHPGLRKEMESWCAFLHEKGPVFARLEKRPCFRTAVLWSETNRAGHVVSSGQKDEYDVIFSALRNAGAGPDLVTDQMVREGVLDRYTALVLCHFNYSSVELWDRIKAFAAAPGKKVFCDETTKLVPPNAVPLGAKWTHTFDDPSVKKHEGLKRTDGVAQWTQRLRKTVVPRLPPPDLAVEEPEGYLAPLLLWAGQTPYLFVLNIDMENRREATVRFKHSGTTAYDLVENKILRLTPEDGYVRIPVACEPGGWQAYALPPSEAASVDVKATITKGRIEMAAAVLDAKGTPIPAAWPLRVEVLDPAGKATSHSVFTTTEVNGQCRSAILLAEWTDPAGAWTVRVRELLSGRTADVQVTLNW